jgi:SAM-dependent methyltransferase
MPGRRARWGTMRRTTPFSDLYGMERGRPVDRFYIDAWIERHAADLSGHVMEVRNPYYVDRFGAPEKVTIVDIDASYEDVTLIADLNEPHSLPADTFDAIILTQVLQYLNPQPALANLWQSLTTGGVLLLTVPALGRIDPETPYLDKWRWTVPGLRDELAQAGIAGEVEGFGNVLAGVCALYGLAVQDVSAAELRVTDPGFPLAVCARAVKED